MLKSAKGVLFLTVFIDLLGYGLVIPLLPDFARGLGASAALVGLVVASYSLMQFVFSPILGSLSDRWGRRPLLLATVALNGLAYVLFGLTESLALLFAARLLAGVGGANLAVAQAYLSDITPPEGRTKAFGMIGAALGLGFVVGPPLGGLVADAYGVPTLGWVVAGLCLVNLLSAALILPETRDQAARTADAAPVGGGAIVRASPTLQRLFAVYLAFITGFGILTVVGALLWADRFGLGERGVGLTFGLIGLVTALIQGFIGRATAGRDPTGVLVAGLGLMALGMTAMPLAPPAAFLTLGLAAIVTFAVGYAFVLPVGTAMVSAEVEPRAQGKVLGLYQALGALGRIIGPLLGGAAYGLDPRAPFFLGGTLLLAALVIATGVRPSPRAATA